MPQQTILFDINETVLDLSSLRPAFGQVFGDEAVMGLWFARLLQSSHLCAMTGVQTGFADLARIVLDGIAQQRGLPLSGAQQDQILGGFAALAPHADIVPALTRLKAAGFQVVAFSNSSLALIERQMAHAGLDQVFDKVLSVEAVGSFKPDPLVYRYAARQLQTECRALTLVACHDWDLHGAMSVGMKGAFVDRLNLPYNPLYLAPQIRGADMIAVADKIVATHSG